MSNTSLWGGVTPHNFQYNQEDAEDRAKTDLASQVIKAIADRRLTQKQAAEIIGTVQPDISKLKNGQVGGFSLDRLLMFLIRLDCTIHICVSSPPPAGNDHVAHMNEA